MCPALFPFRTHSTRPVGSIIDRRGCCTATIELISPCCPSRLCGRAACSAFHGFSQPHLVLFQLLLTEHSRTRKRGAVLVKPSVHPKSYSYRPFFSCRALRRLDQSCRHSRRRKKTCRLRLCGTPQPTPGRTPRFFVTSRPCIPRWAIVARLCIPSD